MDNYCFGVRVCLFQGAACTIPISVEQNGKRLSVYRPYAGHNTFFQDDKNQWRSTIFGNDPDAPVQKRAGLIPVTFNNEGHIQPDMKRGNP